MGNMTSYRTYWSIWVVLLVLTVLMILLEGIEFSVAGTIILLSGAMLVKAVGGGTSEITGVSTQTLEAVVVELVNGTKLLICPL